jgi:hypothetical protein
VILSLSVAPSSQLLLPSLFPSLPHRPTGVLFYWPETPLFASCSNPGESLFGLTLVPNTTVLTEGSAMIGLEYGVPPAPTVNVPPPKELDTHNFPAGDPRLQLAAFEFGKTARICQVPHCRCHVWFL